jgi:hypothetical protein
MHYISSANWQLYVPTVCHLKSFYQFYKYAFILDICVSSILQHGSLGDKFSRIKKRAACENFETKFSRLHLRIYTISDIRISNPKINLLFYKYLISWTTKFTKIY